MRKITSTLKFLFSLSLLFVILSCEATRKFTEHDEDLEMSRDDYYDVLNQKRSSKSIPDLLDPRSSQVPKLSKILAVPKKQSINKSKLISINVTEEVPVRDVLLEIGRVGGVDVQISPKIDGRIIFIARNQSVLDIVERICYMTNIRFQDHGSYINFEPDNPYIKTYNVNFLNMVRSGSMSESISTTLSGSGSGGSQFSVSAKGEDTFWVDLVSNIDMIIQQNQSKKKSDISITSQQLLSEQPKLQNQNALSTNETKIAQNNNIPTSTKNNSTMGLNKQAGMISILATEKAHQKIDEYIKRVRRRMMAQALIEVKILEVTLKETFNAGIDWTLFKNRLGTTTADLATASKNIGIGSFQPSASSFIISAGLPAPHSSIMGATIKALSEFGTTRTLSNPRINALHNQPAALAVAQNYTYFQITVQSQTPITGASTTGGLASSIPITATTSVQQVPIGVVLVLQPSIDLDRREIVMSIKPTITSKVSEVKDPAIELNNPAAAAKGVVNLIPIIATRELDSVVRIKDGDLLIMGGLTERGKGSNSTEVPGVSEVPVLGNLFRSRSKATQSNEIVILIRATIIDEDSDIDEVTSNIYKRFSQDPRMD